MDSPNYPHEERNATRRSGSIQYRGCAITSSSSHSRAPEHSVYSHEGYTSHPRHSAAFQCSPSGSRHSYSSRQSHGHESTIDSTDPGCNPTVDSARQFAATLSSNPNSDRTTSRADTIDFKERRVRLADGNIRTEYLMWYCCQGSHMQMLINSEVCLWTNGDCICGHQFCNDCAIGWSS
jgi:hypothetical protein